MPRIEQAIFAPADPHNAAAYCIVARSGGLIEADARELYSWCPTHDAMLDPEIESLNFHPLPSGAYCVSRTVAAGWFCGSQGGQQSLTHCLIVPPRELARFANDPITLLNAATLNGVFDSVDLSSSSLEPLILPSCGPAVNRVVLSELARDPGPAAMAAIVHLAQSSVSLAFAGARSVAKLIHGSLLCLPPQCRLDFSFSTGLRFSPRRPFHLVATSDDPAEQLWVANHPNVTVFAVHDRRAAHNLDFDGWARLIERVLSGGHIEFFAAELSKPRPDLTSEDLPVLGLQLLEDLDAREIDVREAPDEVETTVDAVPYDARPPRAHAAHHRFEKSVKTTATAKPLRGVPSANLHPSSPEVLEHLEYLDDLVCDALKGQSLAMQQLHSAWPKILAELGDDLLAESREEYLRYAIALWTERDDANNNGDPSLAVHALDVLSLLFGDA